MIYSLSITDPGKYKMLVVKGKEPLREWKRTASLLRSRLGGVWPEVTEIFANPEFDPNGNIEWKTSAFSSLPRPLDVMQGAEKERYEKVLCATADRFQEALASLRPGDEASELIHAILTMPSADNIYCADGKIVIAQWGMREYSSRPPFSLLTFAGESDDAKSAGSANVSGSANASASADKVAEPTGQKKPEPTKIPEIIAVPEVEKTDAKSADGKPIEKVGERVSDKKVAEQKADGRALPPVDTAGKGEDKKRKKKGAWWKWLLLVFGLLLIAGAVFFLIRGCSGSAKAEKVKELPKTSPEISESDIVLSEDSTQYIVGDRLNLMITDKGVDMDKFIADFRKQYPDQEKYQLCKPQAQVGMITLIVPPGEREKLRKEIPAKMKPDYNVLVINEGVGGSSYVPGDPGFSDIDKRYYFDMVNAPAAWDIEKGSANVTVAVLDDGFQVDHPELKGKVVKPYDTVADTPSVQPSQSGHGQHTSTTVGGNADNNAGVSGIAPGCKVMPINVFTDMGAPTSEIIRGIVYAVENGADVISISIGAGFSPMMKFLDVEEQRELARTTGVEEAEVYDQVYQYCLDNDVLVVIAAGNETVIPELDPMKRSDKCMVVSAVDPQGDIAIFNPMTLDGSNWGPRCDISAPGIAIYNAVPNSGYGFMQGTSMACPQVAGGAALVRSHFPNLSALEVKQLLINTARPTCEYVGPLMDLAAALKANPNDPAVTGPKPSTTPQNPGSADPGQDPYRGLYIGRNPGPTPSPSVTPGKQPSPSPSPAVNPGTKPTAPADNRDVERRINEILQEIDALMRSNPYCV